MKPRRRALVIGVAEYGDSRFSNLPAERDVGLVSEALAGAGFEVYDTGESPWTRNKIAGRIRAAIASAERDEHVVVFISSHGIHYGGNDYIVPTDVVTDDPENLTDYLVAIDFKSTIDSSRLGKLAIIVDACREGVKLTENTKRLALTAWTSGERARVQKQDCALVFSCGAGQYSRFVPNSYSLFSKAFADAVAAFGPTNDSLCDLIQDRLHDLSDEHQTPRQLVVTLALSDRADLSLSWIASPDRVAPPYETRLVEFGVLANAYAEIRSTRPPGSARTDSLINVVNAIHRMADEISVSPPEVGTFLRADGDGKRLVGLLLLERHGFGECFEPFLNVLANPVSGFELWHSLEACDSIAKNLAVANRTKLLNVVEGHVQSGIVSEDDDDLRQQLIKARSALLRQRADESAHADESAETLKASAAPAKMTVPDAPTSASGGSVDTVAAPPVTQSPMLDEFTLALLRGVVDHLRASGQFPSRTIYRGSSQGATMARQRGRGLDLLEQTGLLRAPWGRYMPTESGLLACNSAEAERLYELRRRVLEALQEDWARDPEQRRERTAVTVGRAIGAEARDVAVAFSLLDGIEGFSGVNYDQSRDLIVGVLLRESILKHEIPTAYGPSVRDPGRSSEASLELLVDYRTVAHVPPTQPTLHRYELIISVRNTGDSRVDDWYVEIQFPTQMLDSGVLVDIVAERSGRQSTLIRRVMPPLLSGDAKKIELQYRVDNEIFQQNDVLFSQPVVVRVFVNGSCTKQVRRLFRDLQNF